MKITNYLLFSIQYKSIKKFTMRTYNALDISKWFIVRFEDKYITTSKLQRLLYYSEVWTLVLLNRVLLKEEFEAWSLGPTIKEVFSAYKAYENQKIWTVNVLEVKFPRSILEILEQVYLTYGSMEDSFLEISSQNNTPWITARKDLSHEERCHNIIPKLEIKIYFKNKYSM